MNDASQPLGQLKPKFLDRVRHEIRARQYSRRTEDAYAHWIKRFIFFHGKRHPAEMGEAEVTCSFRPWPSMPKSAPRPRIRR